MVQQRKRLFHEERDGVDSSAASTTIFVRWLSFLAVTARDDCVLNVGEDGGVVYRGGNAVTLAVGNVAHGAPQDLARSGLGQAVHESHDISKVSFRAATASSRRV